MTPPKASPSPPLRAGGGESIFLTGAGGFVGRELTRYLRQSGLEVLPCDLSGAERTLDVLDKDALMQAVLELKPFAFVHAAALTSGEDLRLLEVNVQGTLNALEAAKKAGVGHFILFSSCGVYPAQDGPIAEDGITTTAHAYGLSKLLAEQICTAAKSPELTLWILRIGAVYGAGEAPSSTRQRASLIYEISQAISSQTPTRLSRPPSDIHNWLHTQDLARLVSMMVSRPPDGQTCLYNVAGPDISVAELVETFQKHKPEIDLSQLLEYQPNPRPRHGAIDSSKVARELGFVPLVKLEDGLLDYLDPSTFGRGVGVRKNV